MTMCGRDRTLFLTAALAPDLEGLMSGRTYMLMTCHGLTAIDVHEKGETTGGVLLVTLEVVHGDVELTHLRQLGLTHLFQVARS